MIAYYTDENVHGAIVKELRKRGFDVLTTQSDGYGGKPDPEILDRAAELSRVLFSQDDDLLREAKLRQLHGVLFSGVVYAHQDNTTIGECVNGLDFLALAGEPKDFINQVYYLPL